MKNIFKLSLSLAGNQFISVIGAAMCIIFTGLFFGDTILAHIVFLLFTMPFFIYIEYRAAFVHGFHDSNRRNAPNSKSYLYKGLLAGFISYIPIIILIVLYLYNFYSGQIPWANLYKIIIRVSTMYYNFPMCNIFPNHCPCVIISSVIAPLFVPMLGYIAGYKNFVISYLFFKNKKPTLKV